MTFQSFWRIAGEHLGLHRVIGGGRDGERAAGSDAEQHGRQSLSAGRSRRVVERTPRVSFGEREIEGSAGAAGRLILRILTVLKAEFEIVLAVNLVERDGAAAGLGSLVQPGARREASVAIRRDRGKALELRLDGVLDVCRKPQAGDVELLGASGCPGRGRTGCRSP